MAASRLNRCIWQYEVRVAVLTFGFKLPAICTAKFTLRASLAERLAKVDFKNSAPLAALIPRLIEKAKISCKILSKGFLLSA